MIREIDENMIKPEKLLKSTDLAKVGCSDCKGCSDCCKDRAEMITLDPFDVKLLSEGLNFSVNGLIQNGLITFTVEDGVVLPSLPKKPDADECIFLNENGRCSIHAHRPGICRMFPLARIYHEDGTFSYFIQEGECNRLNGVKIKISKWLGYPDLKGYETSVKEFHDALVELRNTSSQLPHEERIALQRKFLEDWYLN